MSKRNIWSIMGLTFVILLGGEIYLVNNCDSFAEEINMEVKIELSDDNIVIGEPLIVTIKMTNTGKLPIELSGSPNAYRIMLSEDGKEYKEYKPTEEMIKAEPAGFLKPGEKYEIQRIVLYTIHPMFKSNDEDMKYFTFPNPGKYFLKGQYWEFASAPVSVLLTQPKGEDAKVWSQLKKTDYPRFVQWKDTSDEKGLNTFKKILQQYPKSTYIPYIREALIKYYRHEKPRTSEGTQYLETLIKEHYPDKKPEPKPSDILDQTIKKLESEWYDVTGFFLGKGNTRGEKEFEEKFLHLSDEQGHGNISEEEFYRQLAELLKKYVRTYSKPLPPDEWKRRYAVYAEDRKTQAEDVQRQIDEYKQKTHNGGNSD